MPMPKPNAGEGHDEFIDRCMGDGTMVDDFPDPAQRQAVCEQTWDDGDKAVAARAKRPQRAWATFEIKAVDEERREIEGWATTPTPDMLGDVVEPDGAEFKLPLPLLWQHDSHQPIGHVVEAKVSKDGIRIRARFVRTDEPGILKDRLDEAWQSVKLRLVRGLSIGFKSLEDSRIKDTFGLRFIRWLWLELSTVTIAANVEATIQTIKAADAGHIRRSVVRVHPPAAAGPTMKGKAMKTIKEQIQSWEATRQAKQARMTEIMASASEKGETLDEAREQEYDALAEEVKRIDGHLLRLDALEKENVAKAAAVELEAGTDPDIAKKARSVPATVRVDTKLEPGIRLARMAMAIARSKASGGMGTPEMFYRQDERWMRTAPEVAQVLKAAINAGDSTTATWASELAYAQNIAAEFVDFLRPLTIIGRMTGWRGVPFNIRVASQTAGSTGYWVGQGKPIPMSQLATSSVSLGIAKVAGMVSIDKELARLSTPSAELLVRNDLAAECQKVLDLSLIDPNQGGQTNIQPASLTYGVTPVTPSGTNYASFVTDVKSLFSTAIAANLDISRASWVLSPTTALALSLMVTSLGNAQFPGLTINGGTLMGLPVVVTSQATIAGSPQFGNIMVLIFPGEVFLADDGAATVEASDQVAIQMLDNPTNQSTATSTATTMVSMFQTESIAVKAVRYINWVKARSQACAFIQAAAYA